MPSPELYKDKIEVSLDGRQIFYLFFGGAVIVGMVFVLGVMVGRRVEARGHLDRAQTQTASDPLAALDRLERSDNLSFHGALTGAEAPTDVEKAIGELHRDGKPAAAAEAKPAVAAPAAVAPAAAAEAAPAADRPRDKHDGDKHDADKDKHKKHDDGDKHADKSDKSDKDSKHASDDGKHASDDSKHASDDSKHASDDSKHASDDGKADKDAKGRFTLQLSSFQDKSEAEAFLSSMKSAGYSPYLTEAEVNGKGTFYRVRLGAYRSMDAASDAKAEYEKTAKKSAQVMRL